MPSALFLTHTVPYPLVSGDRIRNYHLIRELRRRGWSVSLFALDGARDATASDRAALEELVDELEIAPFRVGAARRLQRRATSILFRRPYYGTFFLDDDARARARARLASTQPDVVILEGLYMFPYLPPEWHDRAILDAHNVELRRIESMASALKGKPRGIAAALQRQPTAEYEARAARAVARVTCCSELDAAYFEQLAPGRVDVVPNGVDCEAIRPGEPAAPRQNLLFVGSLDYSANVDAVSYLVHDVAPHIRHRDARLTLVGSHPRREVLALEEESALPVDILGYVESTAPCFDAARVFVVPLRFGGGTRLKILEALARGVPVVSTSVGCEGLDLEHERDLIVADSPAEIASWIDRLLENDELCARLARQGRNTVERLYDWSTIGDALETAADNVAAVGPEYDRRVTGGPRA